MVIQGNEHADKVVRRAVTKENKVGLRKTKENKEEAIKTEENKERGYEKLRQRHNTKCEINYRSLVKEYMHLLIRCYFSHKHAERYD